ncbi:aldose epimerase family protein [Pseudoalteromonas sp. PA2MD11]|uniref:aldose epimerase family protein n=1 Tax=Pseudoalteromonas sp. PA2MD11 TaxID=2785057 RepID=UPI001D18017E|nr:aldose epimerase family protein [Pseudoalteromonas sp. PA2MD11]
MQTITLKQHNGLKVTLSSYGATIRSIEAPNGDHLALCYDNEDDWRSNPVYLGSTIGRVANRIADSKYLGEQRVVNLVANEGANQLHGGKKGLSHVDWQVIDHDISNNKVAFRYVSPSNEQGFPGRVEFIVSYQLSDNQLVIAMQGDPSEITPLSLTNHIYWNLALSKQHDVTDHFVKLPARLRLLKNEQNIANGEFANVYDSHYDFAEFTKLASVLTSNGFDDYYLLDPQGTRQLQLHGSIVNKMTGYQVDIHSTSPGCQFYTGFHLDERYRHIDGQHFGPFMGLCIEPHELPNAVNHSHFLSTQYSPEKPYHQKIVYKIFF